MKKRGHARQQKNRMPLSNRFNGVRTNEIINRYESQMMFNSLTEVKEHQNHQERGTLPDKAQRGEKNPLPPHQAGKQSP